MRGNLNIVLSVLAVMFSVLFVSAAIAGDQPHGGGIYSKTLLLASELYPVADDQPYGTGHMYRTGGRSFTLQGKVVSIDREKKEVTVEASDTALSSSKILEGNVTLSTDKNTKVMICDNMKSLDDLKVGDRVDIKYHGETGNIVAEDISIAQC